MNKKCNCGTICGDHDFNCPKYRRPKVEYCENGECINEMRFKVPTHGSRRLMRLCCPCHDAYRLGTTLEIQRNLKALKAILKTCEDGVIHRNGTGKPQWSAFGHIKSIIRAAIAKQG